MAGWRSARWASRGRRARRVPPDLGPEHRRHVHHQPLGGSAHERQQPEDGERGVVINTSSIAAFGGQVGQVAYTAAKAAIAGMCLTMARDLGSMGIRVLAIVPSLFETGVGGAPED
nr:SDR family NAD(P)-dependent oxidoreductase [Saccharopolyspora aridisoli]